MAQQCESGEENVKTRGRNLIDTDHVGLTQMSLHVEDNGLLSPMSGSPVITKATCMNKTRSINLSGRDEVDLLIGATFGVLSLYFR